MGSAGKWPALMSHNHREDEDMSDRTIEMRCKAFREGVRMNRVQVDDGTTVRVWDSVAGHYTTCHRLSAAAQRRARREADQDAALRWVRR